MAKRFLKPAINWKEIEKRVSPEQKEKFLNFRGKSDVYLRRALANPPESPKIDWDEYKKKVPVPGLVDKFKSQYETMKIPYPTDNLSVEVDKQWESLQPEMKKFNEEMDEHINKACVEIKRIHALPRFEDMTLEMVYDVYPDIAMDFVKKPSFWPHTADEQLGYVDPAQKIDL